MYSARMEHSQQAAASRLRVREPHTGLTERQGANSRGSRRPQWGSVREGLKLGKILEKDKTFEGTSGPRESVRVS
jgi:hypothetical protein